MTVAEVLHIRPWEWRYLTLGQQLDACEYAEKLREQAAQQK